MTRTKEWVGDQARHCSPENLGTPGLALQTDVQSEFLLLVKTGDGEWCSYIVLYHQERTEQCCGVTQSRLKAQRVR